MWEQSYILDGITDMPAQTNQVPVSNGFTVHNDLALLTKQQAIDEFEGGGFAGTAAPQQHQSFTMSHLEIEFGEQHSSVCRTVGYINEFDCCVAVLRHRSIVTELTTTPSNVTPARAGSRSQTTGVQTVLRTVSIRQNHKPSSREVDAKRSPGETLCFPSSTVLPRRATNS